jgi:ABC-2 type transport system permease protein
MLPEDIKYISIISPLRWGIESFIDLFVRNEGFSSILSNIVKLCTFFALALAISLVGFLSRN